MEELYQIDPFYSVYYFDKYAGHNNLTAEMPDTRTGQKPLEFSESVFRGALHPVLWLDQFGDVHWNDAAEREMYQYLLNKQYPKFSNINESSSSSDRAEAYISDCQSRQLIILPQWLKGGFFSRYHCFIEQFGQTLYSPLMAVLTPRLFYFSNADQDDYLAEGILGYLAPMSLCSGYMHHPKLKDLSLNIKTLTKEERREGNNYVRIDTIEQLRSSTIRAKNKQLLVIPHVWKFSYEHIPHRRWLFDYDRIAAKHNIHYYSSIADLVDHSNEHIYRSANLTFNPDQWEPRNRPWQSYSDNLQNSNSTLTWKDKVFTSFLRYMFILFFYQPVPRVQFLTKLLHQHWITYLAHKTKQTYELEASAMAGIFIRRGDKMSEDSFYLKHGYWRNISLYIKGLRDEERRRHFKFTPIFVLTDDADVMSSIIQYSNISSVSNDEIFARKHLSGRQIIYNIYAPQRCFNPFNRVGFDQFLVNINFLIQYSKFIVGHTDSNIGRFLEEIIYAQSQLNEGIQTQTSVKNAPDT